MLGKLSVTEVRECTLPESLPNITPSCTAGLKKDHQETLVCHKVHRSTRVLTSTDVASFWWFLPLRSTRVTLILTLFPQKILFHSFSLQTHQFVSWSGTWLLSQWPYSDFSFSLPHKVDLAIHPLLPSPSLRQSSSRGAFCTFYLAAYLWRIFCLGYWVNTDKEGCKP